MLRFHVPSMACGGCARSITKAVQGADAAARVEADLDARDVRITSTLDERKLLSALEAAGFPAERRP